MNTLNVRTLQDIIDFYKSSEQTDIFDSVKIYVEEFITLEHFQLILDLRTRADKIEVFVKTDMAHDFIKAWLQVSQKHEFWTFKFQTLRALDYMIFLIKFLDFQKIDLIDKENLINNQIFTFL